MSPLSGKMKAAFDSLPDASTVKIDDASKEEDAYKDLLEQTISSKMHEVKLLLKIKENLGTVNHDEMMRTVKSFLRANEHNFYNAKPLYNYRLAFDKQEIKSPASASYYDTYGRCDDFSCTMVKENPCHYVLTLPPMVGKKTTEKKVKEGIALTALVVNLIHTFDVKTGDLEMIEHPVAVFIHHIEKDKAKMFIPDADNLDVKVVLDALQGFLISDDNLAQLTLMQSGIFSDEAFTELHLMDQETFPVWMLEKGQKLLKK